MSTSRSDAPRRSAACAVVRDVQERILLQQRSDNGRWGLPGGGIRMDETAEQAVVREVQEETGYEVEARRLIGVYSLPTHTTITYPDGNAVCYVALCFDCRVVGGRPARSEETLEVAWFPPESLPASVTAGHRQRIQDARANTVAAFMR